MEAHQPDLHIHFVVSHTRTEVHTRGGGRVPSCGGGFSKALASPEGSPRSLQDEETARDSTSGATEESSDPRVT